MIIESIKIENFRGIEYLEIPTLDEHINLFVGVNGSGKTSVLDSFSLVMSWLLARIRNPKSSGTLISESDIKNNSKGGCSISIKVRNSGEWILYRSKSYAKSKVDNGKTELRDMMEYINEIHHCVTQGGNIPIIMYYPVNRAINNAPAHLKRGGKEPEIWDTYENALKGNTEFRSFFEWYRKQEDNENEHIRDNRSYQDKKLSAIREAIKRFFPDFSDLRVHRNPQRYVIQKDSEIIEFNQLSQGEKCYLALVCDLARRFAMANPNSDYPLQGEGIVFIDEVDLHLHPKWQMEIIDKLRTIFPNCQFFLSSHSPHVLSDLTPRQIFILDNGNLNHTSFNPYGKLVNEVLANYFSISMARNLKVKEQINKAYKALKENDSTTFQEIFEELGKQLGKLDPDMVNLKLESVRKKNDEKKNKSWEPSSLTKLKRKTSSNKWEDIHTEQNRSIYEDCLFQCMDDQNYLCGYTEIKLDDNYHIDHFIKRDIDPRQTFDWQNMIAAVHDSKFGADFKDKTVNKNDYNKRLKKYNCILNPVTENMENRFIFSTNGVIEPADRNDREATETIRVFNLQEDSLNSRRKQAMENTRKLLEQMDKEAVIGYLQGEEFPSAIAYEISKSQ